jgi:hypothetical protein
VCIPSFSFKTGGGLLGGRVDLLDQARLHAGTGVQLENAVLDSLVDGLDGGLADFLSFLHVLGFQSLAHGAAQEFDGLLHLLVAGGPLDGLAEGFFC